MKLAMIEWEGLSRVALVLDAEVIDLTAQLGLKCNDVTKFLAMGAEACDAARRCQKRGTARLPLSTVRLRAPVLQAQRIFGVGMNYHSFVTAMRRHGMAVPEERVWFQRPRSCISGPYDDVWLPYNTSDFDYEGELAVVIGSRCRHVSRAHAPAVVAGFTIANDLTLREWARKSIVLGKSFDTHTPLGPWLVTREDIGDPHDLLMQTWVNGELRQRARTAEMITGCYELIAEISSACILYPGDIILTGTPDGCGIFRQPFRSLAAGDVVRIEIEGIGVIENRVIDEPLQPWAREWVAN